MTEEIFEPTQRELELIAVLALRATGREVDGIIPAFYDRVLEGIQAIIIGLQGQGWVFERVETVEGSAPTLPEQRVFTTDTLTGQGFSLVPAAFIDTMVHGLVGIFLGIQLLGWVITKPLDISITEEQV